MKQFRFWSFLFSIVLWGSCAKDFSVLSNYKESVIVYGLLDQSQPIQYIKVNKAFLGPGNALTMAQDFDSINFHKHLHVKLQAIDPSNGNIVKTINFHADTLYNKPAGQFAFPKQLLFSSTSPLDLSKNYNLIVSDTFNNVLASASTQIVDSVPSIKQPSSPFLAFSLADSVPMQVEWNSCNLGKIYGISFRLYYVEQNKTTLVSTQKYIDWVMPYKIADYANEDLLISVPGRAFYQFLGSQLPYDAAVRRFIRPQKPGSLTKNMDIILTVGSQDLYTYIQISQPSTSITQNPPQYSNVKNGFGLFSSRRVEYLSGSMGFSGFVLTPASIDSLYLGQYTRNSFCDSIPASPYYCK